MSKSNVQGHQIDLSSVPSEVGAYWFDRAGHRCRIRSNGSIEVITLNEEPSMTIQSEKDSCDINKIVAKFGLTRKPIKAIASELAMTSHVRQDQPVFGDFTGISDYATAVIKIREAEEQFSELPSAIRKRFSNDPQNLVDFLQDPNNLSEAIQLGLVEAKPTAGASVQPQHKPSSEGDKPSPIDG